MTDRTTKRVRRILAEHHAEHRTDSAALVRIMNHRANAVSLNLHCLDRAGVYRRFIHQHGNREAATATPEAQRRFREEVRERIAQARRIRFQTTMGARLP